MGGEQPFVEPHAADPEWIVEILVGPAAEPSSEIEKLRTGNLGTEILLPCGSE